MRRFYAPLVQVVRTIVRGPDPITAANVTAVDLDYTRRLAGRASDIRFGEPSDPAIKYSGDLGPLQNFRGAAFVGANPVMRPGFNQALPGTNPPVGELNDALAAIRRTQVPR